MPLLNWKDEFETGIAYIDFEHRGLVKLINKTCDSLDQESAAERIAACLGDLYARICAPFALEEELMREKKYALYEIHKADHERLLEELCYMMDAFEAGACENCGKTLDDSLTAWFRQHFQIEDPRFQTLGV
jgi:hemerythrin